MMNYFKKEDPKETMKKVKRETKREVRVRELLYFMLSYADFLATDTDASFAAATFSLWSTLDLFSRFLPFHSFHLFFLLSWNFTTALLPISFTPSLVVSTACLSIT